MFGIHSPERRASPRHDAPLGTVGLLGLWRWFSTFQRQDCSCSNPALWPMNS
jgi:hypothetical protein